MEAEQIVKGILDGVYFSSCDVNPTDETSWWFVINYSDLYSFAANGICNYYLELWLTLRVYSMELLW